MMKATITSTDYQVTGDIVAYFDFTDCISDEPIFGEVGYKDDIRELLEYPCNCVYCLERAGINVEDSNARTGRAEGDD